MMKYFRTLFTFTIIQPLPALSQKQISVTDIGGTVIIGCICKNGIVFGADSRSSWLDASGKVVAYDDNTKKIYSFDNFIFTRAGKTSFPEGNLTFGGLFNKFKQSSQKNVNVSNFYSEFFSFAKKTLSKNDYDMLLLKNQVIVGGYINDVPHLYYYNENKVDSVTTPDYRQNGLPDVGKPIHNQMQALLIKYDINQTINFVDLFIQNVIKDRNKTAPGDAGGVSSICVLYNGQVNWIKNNIDNKYDKTFDYLRDILKRKIKIKFRSDNDSVLFYKLLEMQVK